MPSPTLFGTPYSDIANEVGILGTGAIDSDRGVLFLVADTLKNGKPAYFLHALDLTSGQERLNGPVEIQAQSSGVAFAPQQHLQRPGLLLANGFIYIAFGSHADQSPWHGWIVSYDASDLTQQNGVFLTTQSGNGGSIWQSGRGLAADSAGKIYAITGNGDYDGTQNFSQSFLRFSGTKPSLDAWYTPPNWKDMSDNDFDLAAGPILISATGTLLGADKAGNLYLVGEDAWGRSAAACAHVGKLFSGVHRLHLQSGGLEPAGRRAGVRAGEPGRAPVLPD